MSDSSTTTRIVLASRPQGAPTAANFRLEQAALPPLGDGEVLLRNRYLSLDPYMRGRMDEGPSYAAPVAVEAVMEGQTVAEVLQSRAAGVAVGERVLAPGGWQTHAVLPAKALGRRLDPAGLPLSTALGVYGMPGFTAYSSLHEISRLQPGETLVVAAATGPVGATVAQLAKLQGARVVAIAGGEAKRAYLQTLGVDVALDHRAADFAEQLRARYLRVSTCTSRTSGAMCWMRCCRCSTTSPAFRCAAPSPPTTIVVLRSLARTACRCCSARSCASA